MLYKLEELCEIKYGKNQKKVENPEGEFPIFGTGGLMGFADQFLYDKPSVLIPRKGSISKVAFSEKPFWTVDTLFFTIVKEEIVLPKFLYYVLSKIDLSKYNEGTTIPSLRTETLNRITLEIPNLLIQSKIVDVLDSFEMKVTINQQIISKLEAISSNLFKHWFIDFEYPNEQGQPYKSSGGEMVESDLGFIPKKWEINILKDYIDIIDNRGKTPPLEKEVTKFPIIDVRALSGDNRIINYLNCTKYVSQETYNSWFRSGHPHEGDILLSTVGSVGEMKIFTGNRGVIAQNVVALRSKDLSNIYLFQYLLSIRESLKSYNIGSVQTSIKVTHIIKHPIIIPEFELVRLFHENIKAMQSKIVNLSKENVNLVLLRDTLLPKLLSGEIEVLLPENEK